MGRQRKGYGSKDALHRIGTTPFLNLVPNERSFVLCVCVVCGVCVCVVFVVCFRTHTIGWLRTSMTTMTLMTIMIDYNDFNDYNDYNDCRDSDLDQDLEQFC